MVGDHALSRVYSPVGLDIGAESPEEVALAILAEIKAAATGVFAGALMPELAALDGDAGAEQVIRRHPDEVASVPCAHGACDIYTIEDYETIGSSGDSAVRSPDLP